jgi:hypothetical protein
MDPNDLFSAKPIESEDKGFSNMKSNNYRLRFNQYLEELAYKDYLNSFPELSEENLLEYLCNMQKPMSEDHLKEYFHCNQDDLEPFLFELNNRAEIYMAKPHFWGFVPDDDFLC